jgi:hypothetical protein
MFWWEQHPWVVIFSRDRGMDHLLDAETAAILFREPTGMARLLADPVKAQLPIGV